MSSKKAPLMGAPDPAVKSAAAPKAALGKKTNYRYIVMVMLFLMTAINYADRSTLSITGAAIKNDLGMSSVSLGYLFAAFAWSYMIAQIPAGSLLDRIGARLTYALSIGLWSILTCSMGFIAGLPVAAAITALFVARVMIGAVEAPVFPANNRISAIWFPAHERGMAAALFTSAQYFAKVVFAPLMGYITQYYGWNYVYFAIGPIGLVLTLLWWKLLKEPSRNSMVNAAELQYMRDGGAVVDIDAVEMRRKKSVAEVLRDVKKICSNRMMIGVLLAQYCLATLTAFFLTWFPMYLIEDRGMSIAKAGLVSAIPALTGFIGGVLGGFVSDLLIKRGYSITFSRKVPIVVGMLMSTTLILCNFIDDQIILVAIMAFSFLGKAFGTQGWAVLSEIAPKESVGLAASLLNGFGSVASIISPIVVGYLIHATGNFSISLVFIALHAVVAALLYLFFVGPLRRIVL